MSDRFSAILPNGDYVRVIRLTYPSTGAVESTCLVKIPGVEPTPRVAVRNLVRH